MGALPQPAEPRPTAAREHTSAAPADDPDRPTPLPAPPDDLDQSLPLPAPPDPQPLVTRSRRGNPKAPAPRSVLAPAMADDLQALADDPLQPDLVHGFSPHAAVPDTTRLWMAMVQRAPEGSLLSVAMVARRSVESGTQMEVGVPVGDPMNEVYLRVALPVPAALQLGDHAGMDGAQLAVMLLDRAMTAIAKTASALTRGWPQPEAMHRYSGGQLLKAVADNPRTAKMAQGYIAADAPDTVTRTVAIWRQLAADAPDNELLGKCGIDVDARRGEVLVNATQRCYDRDVTMTRAVPMNALQPDPGGDPRRRAAALLAQALNLMVDSGSPERVWQALGRTQMTPGRVYQQWRYAVEAAPAGSDLASMTCRSHGGAVTLSAPVGADGTVLVRHLDPAAPRALAAPMAVLRDGARDLAKARCATLTALGAPDTTQHLAPADLPATAAAGPQHLAPSQQQDTPPKPRPGRDQQPRRGR